MKFRIRTPHYIDDRYYDTKDGSVTFEIDETVLKGRPPSMQMEPMDAEAEKAWRDYHQGRPGIMSDIGETQKVPAPAVIAKPAPEVPKYPEGGRPITGHSKVKV